MDIDTQTLRFARPFETSYGTLRERQTLIVELTDDDGITGYGEAAPLEPYDGVAIEEARAALMRCREALRELPGAGPDARGCSREPAPLQSCRRVCRLPQALAAVDVALWDIAARRARRPLAFLLSERNRPAERVRMSATIAALDPAEAARQAVDACARGFDALKVKVGAGEDLARVRAVRQAAGPQVALRLDANGAWDVEQAARAIEALAPAGLEMVEEPVHGVAATRALCELVSVPIALDESSLERDALERSGAAAVCLKLSRSGGITGLLAAAAHARAGGHGVYVGSTLDGPLGIAASLHAAAALAADGPLAPCGLATLELFAGMTERLVISGGEMLLPQAPGLGVRPG